MSPPQLSGRVQRTALAGPSCFRRTARPRKRPRVQCLAQVSIGHGVVNILPRLRLASHPPLPLINLRPRGFSGVFFVRPRAWARTGALRKAEHSGRRQPIFEEVGERHRAAGAARSASLEIRAAPVLAAAQEAAEEARPERPSERGGAEGVREVGITYPATGFA